MIPFVALKTQFRGETWVTRRSGLRSSFRCDLIKSHCLGWKPARTPSRYSECVLLHDAAEGVKKSTLVFIGKAPGVTPLETRIARRGLRAMCFVAASASHLRLACSSYRREENGSWHFRLAAQPPAPLEAHSSSQNESLGDGPGRAAGQGSAVTPGGVRAGCSDPRPRLPRSRLHVASLA